MKKILIFIGIVFLSSVSGTSVLVEIPITTHGSWQENPAIYGNIVVWQDNRNGGWPNIDIYGYNLATSTEFQITKSPSTEYNPAIYGNIVVWEDYRNGNPDIYGCNLVTKEEFPIVTDPSDQYNPEIYGSTVVWQDWRNGNGDIYGCNLATQEEFQITTDVSKQAVPAIYGSTVVWQDNRNGIPDIYGYNLVTKEEFQITTDPHGQECPSIYGSTVVWHDWRNDVCCFQNADIYGCNLVTKEEFSIATDKITQKEPAIYENIVVWQDGSYNVVGYNLLTAAQFQIANAGVAFLECIFPAVYCNIVVWGDWRNGNSDIYGAVLDRICVRPTFPVYQYRDMKFMEPLARTTILKAANLQVEAQNMLLKVQEKGVDTSWCENVFVEAGEFLEKAQRYFRGGNYIAANNCALRAIQLYEEVIELLTGFNHN